MASHFSLSGVISRRSFIRGGVAASAALALAGCGQPGSNQPGSSDATSTSDSSSTSGSSEVAKISFVLDYTPNTNHTGIYVAQSKGFFAEEGLDVEIVQPPEDGADALIGAGGAQMGVSYQDVMANSLSSDQPMPYTAVAAIIQHNTSGIMSRAADGITRPKLMENHTYATWDQPVEQATIKDVVEADGGDFSRVSLVPYNVDDEVSGLKANMFDTVWVYEGWAVQNAKVQNYDVNYFSFISIDDVFDYYTPVIAANDDFAKANPDLVKAFLRAAKRGYEYAVEDPDDAAEVLCTAVPELDADLVHASQNYLATQYIADASSWGVIDSARWAKFYQWLNDQNLVENKLDVNRGFDLSYLEA
ncbi:ABC transporter substrate-binding protein [Olsenella sp. Marseille-P4559]|uniref:ABC transporter substrate-binding protein n=1 Tax=Olsenella sp. Marseille-P4559 TaxID=2364795 RepID=UPI00103258C0|nr:ABC transporter substrate-binding protein [Olsenella sp. Marseille-P4559]